MHGEKRSWNRRVGVEVKGISIETEKDTQRGVRKKTDEKDEERN